MNNKRNRTESKARAPIPFVMLVLTLFLLAACGGGGSGDGGGGGGTSGLGTTVGTVSGFGSVIVNGIEFETQDAEVEIEGEVKAGSVDDNVKVGMLVRIEGEVNDDGRTGRADRVRFDHNLEGRVDDVSRLSVGQLGVMGQTFVLDDLTVFENTTPGTLQVDDIVEVSGLVDEQGRIRATFVEKKAGTFVNGQTEIELKGEIKAGSLTAQTFMIGDLTVSYTVQVLDDSITDAGGLQEGMFVEVKGNSFDGNDQLVATEVELEDRMIDPAPGNRVELEGIVTRFVSGQDFDVGGQPVRLASGVSAAGIAEGVRLKIRGTLQNDDVVLAREVTIPPRRNVKIEADVSSVDDTAGTVTVFASATAGTPGIVVETAASTELRDKTDDAVNLFPPISGLQTGQRVKIRAFQSDGDVVAAKIEREDRPNSGRVRLQGPVSSKDEPNRTLVILGVTVDGTGAVFRLGDDSTAVGPSQFFAAVSAGTLVKATGTFSEATGIIAARELELEGEDENEFEFEFENEFQFEFEDEQEQEFENESRGRNRGRIDRFGSIFLDGREIETRGATVSVDDRPGVESDLALGMMVDVEVRIDDTTGDTRATHIEFDNELQGPITAPVFDPGPPALGTLLTGTLEVMGRTVKLDDTTIFANVFGASALVMGDIVEVSGSRDRNGVIHATRVELKGANFDDLPEDENELEIKGVVTGPITASTFTIGDLVVDFSDATFDPLIGDSTGLVEGMVVEVKSNQPLAQDGSLRASFIQFEDDALIEDEGVEVRIKGLVTSVTSGLDFEVEGQRVLADPQDFSRGTQDDVVPGRQVEVEGVMDAVGNLVAEKVQFELAKNVKIEAEVEDKDAVAGTVVVLGVTVKVDDSTQMEDKRDGLRSFGLDGLANDDRVEVRAFVDDQGNAVAAKLEREDPRSDGRVRLQGPLDHTSTPAMMAVLGAQIDTATITRFEDESGNRFEDSTGNPDPTAFLAAALQEGKLAKFRGTKAADGTVEWERAEIEIEHEFENDAENEFEFELENEMEDEVENEDETSG